MIIIASAAPPIATLGASLYHLDPLRLTAGPVSHLALPPLLALTHVRPPTLLRSGRSDRLLWPLYMVRITGEQNLGIVDLPL